MPNGSLSVEDQVEFSTADFALYDKADPTKKARPNLSGSATGTTAIPVFEGQQITTVASGGTTNIGAANTTEVSISGTTTITAFDTVQAGIYREGVFQGALTLTHNATSLILPGGASITTAAGDTFGAVSLGSGNWRVLWYTKASGQAVVATASGYSLLGTANSTGATTLTLGSLTLTGYKFLQVVFTGLSSTFGSTFTVNGKTIAVSGGDTGVFAGWMMVDLTSGVAVVSTFQTSGTVSTTSSGSAFASGLSTASTAVTITSGTGTFDGSPSMKVYAI